MFKLRNIEKCFKTKAVFTYVLRHCLMSNHYHLGVLELPLVKQE